MVEPISLAVAITLLVKSAPDWLPILRDTFLSKVADRTIDKVIQPVSALLDEKEQQRHLELALKNAAERGLAAFHSQKERDEYRDILVILSEAGPNSLRLRSEAMELFSLFGSANIDELKEIYNRSIRTRTLSQKEAPKDVDVAPYLGTFFEALKAELFIDPLFHRQISDVLMIQNTLSIQRSMKNVIATLSQIDTNLTKEYSIEQFELNIKAYTVHIERAFRYLKLVGVVPKDQGNNTIVDPILEAIFVPLHIASQEKIEAKQRLQEPIITLMERSPYLVLLGDPGSGKSTLTRYLAWTHARANLPSSTLPLSNYSPLPGNPLPLRIELRLLREERKQRPEYDFLSYTTDVLLGRSGIHINRQMFEELLERRAMLLLFDGLDEVPTLHERRGLIEEIENFVERYPGNRILVTSRPVGYQLARFSDRWFSHAQIEEFDDSQIRMFLERWYTYVLRLTPLLLEDQEELEALYRTLIDNQQLHSLAMNPLLLTVVTALHRYERLPDKRVRVYDRCAEILLDTWAKLKGINAQLGNMILSKEDQYACIAHLGFVLHNRSQEREKDSTDKIAVKAKLGTRELVSANTTDVTARFILREIDRYFESQKLFSTSAQQHAEAERFLELMRVEAGIIVERGVDEGGEALYGFVHSTFQEYFAAADVYERYLQEEDSMIISQFLSDHLYDSHWYEVILLLFGKLKRKPATYQLRQILGGKFRSHPDRDPESTQEDLFFVCSCLAEEIVVENELAVSVISRLSDLVKNSSSRAQRSEALEVIASLGLTRQYANLVQEELKAIITQNEPMDINARIHTAQTLYKSFSPKLQERLGIHQMLLDFMQRPDLSFEQATQVAQALYEYSSFWSEEEQQYAIRMLLNLTQRPDFLVEQIVQTAEILNRISPNKSPKFLKVPQMLLSLAQQPTLSVKQIFKRAQIFYWNNFN